MRTESREGLAYVLREMKAELTKERQKLQALEGQCAATRGKVDALSRRIVAIAQDLEE